MRRFFAFIVAFCAPIALLLTPLGCDHSPDPAPAAPVADGVAFYTCPMHPSVHQASPGSCPICGMNLVPVSALEASSGAVIIDAARRQKVGITLSPAVRAPLISTRSAYGTVELDPAQVTVVSPRVSGTIRDLKLAAPGQLTSKGARLGRMISPELISAQGDLLASRGTPAEASALARLRLWMAPESLITRLLAGGPVEEAVDITAPVSGVAMAVTARVGASFMAGEPLFELASLDPIWIEGRIYAEDQGTLSVGQAVTIWSPDRPTPLTGAVLALPPELDPSTRARLVRVSAPNPDAALLPGQAVDLRWTADLGVRLTVPSEAVIYAGQTRLVFVHSGEGRLSPRVVTTGQRAGDTIEIVSGLSEGESVVSSGTFLVASESRIRSATSVWGAPPPSADAHVH